MTKAARQEKAATSAPLAKTFAVLGVAAAIVLAVNVNVLVGRFYQRWDVTSEGLYTLSPATLGILHALDDGVSVTVLLARTDPLLSPARQMLSAYGAETQKLEIRYLDPEQNPAELVAVQKRFGILAGKAEDGRIVTDAVILISRGERTWFVTADELSAYDDEGRARPRLEQVLTEGIANVTRGEAVKICFATGHGEASIDDVGPDGLAELRRILEKSNYQAEPVDLTKPNAAKALEGCRLLVVAAPRLQYGAAAAQNAERFAEGGGSLVLFLGPELGEDLRVAATGLERLSEKFGIRLERRVAFETDPSLRLPRGAGEVFVATPLDHPVTRGLVREGGKVDFPVVVSQPRTLSLLDDGSSRSILVSSDRALGLENLKGLVEGNPIPDDAEGAERILGAAAELPKPRDSKEPNGPRAVVLGSATLPGARTFRDPALVGGRFLVENAISWAAARPVLVSVPEKPARSVGLALSEESLAEILRYVLIYMPGCAALTGLVVLYRRRAEEKRSRRAAAGGTA